jgi:hypothetical protein
MISASSHPTKTGTAIFRKSAQGTKKNGDYLSKFGSPERLLWTGTGGCGALWGGGAFNFGLESITSAVNGDDLGMMKQAVEDGAGGRDVTEQFAPFFNRLEVSNGWQLSANSMTISSIEPTDPNLRKGTGHLSHVIS